ncbi:PAS domain S-box protein [uncultured Maritimibacter sp.]|jgi:methyl-accepting chemotaxis protein|uniref:methyl-accepting chemotaxis protein n=1 Tax=uncultured Maritimibacter sp. TaxID=991866 RepID=UPI000AF40C05|nr:PAS domain S-box protein [uncultured Maritimibacter sp.]
MFNRSRAASTAPATSRASATLQAATEALAIIWFDTDGGILDANPNFCRTMKYDQDALRGQHHRIFMPPGVAEDDAYARFWVGLRSGKAQSGTFTRRRKDGTLIYLEASYVPLRATDGTITGFVKFASDVTDKVRADMRHAAMIEAIDRANAVVEFTPDGTVTRANQTFCTVLGYGAEQIVDMKHSAFMPSGQGEGPIYAAFWEKLRKGEFLAGEFLRRSRSGADIWIQASYTPVLDPEGRVVGVVKLARDITARKQSELDVRGQIEALERSQAVIEFDPSGHILTANANFLALMGYGLDDIRGKHHRLFMDQYDVAAPEYAAFWDSLRAGRYHEGEFRRRTRTGADVWIQATYNPVRDKDGQVVKVVKFASDISDRKRAIIDLRDSILRLSGGDLSQRMTSTMPPDMEPLRLMFNDALDRLTNLVGAIIEGAGATRVEVEGINAASEDLGRRNGLQARALTETTTAMSGLGAMIRDSRDRATEAATVVGRTRERSSEGRQVIEATVRAMTAIAASSTQISKITGLIDDIAFQTNLLALNAGVEAARAGESGRGFAVVASEVRALAQRSSDAARQIADLITASERQVSEGVALVDQSGSALGEIDDLVTTLGTAVDTIATSAREQFDSLGRIDRSIEQLNQVTAENGAMLQETLDAVHALRDQTERLVRESDVFSIAPPDTDHHGWSSGTGQVEVGSLG